MPTFTIRIPLNPSATQLKALTLAIGIQLLDSLVTQSDISEERCGWAKKGIVVSRYKRCRYANLHYQDSIESLSYSVKGLTLAMGIQLMDPLVNQLKGRPCLCRPWRSTFR